MDRRIFGIAVLLIAAINSTCANELQFDFQDAVGDATRGWSVPTAGYTTSIEGEPDANRFLELRLEQDKGAPFGNVMRTLNALDYRNQRILLTARVRVLGGFPGRAQMWLRVDRAGGRVGGFDNMSDRPIRSDQWTTARIEVDVDADAFGIAIGFMTFQQATIQIDDIKLETRGESLLQSPSPAQTLSRGQIDRIAAATRTLGYVRFFCPTQQVREFNGWNALSVELFRRAESAQNSAELVAAIQQTLTPLAPDLQVWRNDTGTPPAEPAWSESADRLLHWEHRGVSLISAMPTHGIYESRLVNLDADDADERAPPMFVTRRLPANISCRLPIRVAVGPQGTVPSLSPDQLEVLKNWETAEKTRRLTTLNRWTRYADIAHTWNVFQHFYPYFDVVDVNWTDALDDAIRRAGPASDESEALEILELMTAKLRDGHVRIAGANPQIQRRLPIELQWIGSDCVVIGVDSAAESDITVGDIVSKIDGHDVEAIHQRMAPRISAATEGWLRYRSAQLIVTEQAYSMRDPTQKSALDEHNQSVEVRYTSPNSPAVPQTARLSLTMKPIVAQPTRPEQGEEVESGIMYFDLNGATSESLNRHLDQLSAADAIIFDLRGYPNSAAYDLLRHLTKDRLQSAQWIVPVNTVPDQGSLTWQSLKRWDLRPLEPHLGMPIAFLTDARAISYAESILGIVEHYRLGEIVGSSTAGTNGNVNPFTTPSGFRITWTGMRVLKHDGSPHHGVGIKPTISVRQTAAGIAVGRDAVLGQAIATLRAKLEI